MDVRMLDREEEARLERALEGYGSEGDAEVFFSEGEGEGYGPGDGDGDGDEGSGSDSSIDVQTPLP